MIVELDNVSFCYPTPNERGAYIIDQSSLSISIGEILCILGESGSGKTTLLNLLAGVIVPTSGSIRHSDVTISYLSQDDLLLPFRTVWQNSFLAAELTNSLSEGLFIEGRALLNIFRLDQFSENLPLALSGGMRRRVALTRQLLRPFNVLLLDEPFGAQDRGMRQILEDTVDERSRHRKKAAVIVTHDIDSAVALADRIVILGTTKQLREIWICPQTFSTLRPAERRAHPEFADNVAVVWRRFWEATRRD